MQTNSHKQELKSKILGTTSKMFRTNGIRQVKMDDIARSLSISKRTLYEIYENKEELLMDVVKFQEEQFSKTLESKISKDSNTIEILVEFYHLQMKVLSEVNPIFFEDIHAYDSVIDYIHKEHDRRSENKRMFVQRAINEGYFLSNLNYEVVFNILEASSEYIMNENLYKKYGMPTIFHNFVVVFFRGVCTERGMVQLDKLMKNI